MSEKQICPDCGTETDYQWLTVWEGNRYLHACKCGRIRTNPIDFERDTKGSEQ